MKDFEEMDRQRQIREKADRRLQRGSTVVGALVPTSKHEMEYEDDQMARYRAVRPIQGNIGGVTGHSSKDTQKLEFLNMM